MDTSASYLDLSFNQLTELPESLAQLTSLRFFFLSNNQLTELPEWLVQLTSLQSLDLSGNPLTELPEWLVQFTSLQSLSVSNNQLTELPEWLVQLTSLRFLELNRIQLWELPEWLGQLTSLQSLSLRGNQFKELPEWLGQLTSLQSLFVSDNQLTELPEWLGKLTSLQLLDLGSNQLSELPEWLGQLTALQSLDLRSNQLTELPEFLRNLPRLDRLFLHGNPSLNIPEEILGASYFDSVLRKDKAAPPESILSYYFSTRGDEGAGLRELKLLVVGRGQAGKTSLVRRLNGEPLNSVESETHGINISPLTLNCEDGDVTARTWDFGGQHVLHAMHEFFLTARSLYLLVLGEREDMAERDATYWLQLIRSYAGGAPVVVALNKSKGTAREMDRESLEQKYGPILAWIPTECEAGYEETIENLRTALTEAAERMPEVRNRFPKKWWQIKEWLEEMEEPYLDFATYQERCGTLGESDPEQQEKLATWLNDLGIAINYAEDERLHDTTVLQPEWLANGIYAILRANDSHHPQKYAPDATLTENALGPIYEGAEKLKMLKAADYPEEKWPFLMRLMSLFQLAFPIDEKGETLLVPSLLPLEAPPDTDEPADPDRTRVRYEFSVVPGPLLPKFLVRTFSLIDGAKRWRRGAILRYGEAMARVWMTQDERWVHITATGNQEDREELLTMIRLTLSELFAEYKNLKVVEQWELDGDWVPRQTLEKFGVLPKETDQDWGEVER
ncbi:MAG: leucine-rich repeat domain-containing protein [Verrucomicrobiae bacterium]|nr:leucine-rich repeat domain-containing protein [Verrucomicrobiae bacterium]